MPSTCLAMLLAGDTVASKATSQSSQSREREWPERYLEEVYRISLRLKQVPPYCPQVYRK